MLSTDLNLTLCLRITIFRSCLTNLLAFLESVTKSVDDGHNVDLMFLDFVKAFDKVPHQSPQTADKAQKSRDQWEGLQLDTGMVERSETTCVLQWLSLIIVGCNKWRSTRLGARSDTLPHLHRRHRLQNRQPVNEVCR